MRNRWIVTGLTGCAACLALGPGCADDTTQAKQSEEPVALRDGEAAAPTLLDRTMRGIDGSEQDLSRYRGKVVLVVNVASECGLTPQYEGLQSLYEQKMDQGFVVLGFPANNFGGQEPGTDAQIVQFCTENYSVTFPMFSKISVLGEDQDALFASLSARSEEPSWNFTKYLIDRDGNLVQRFDPRTKPDDPGLVERIDGLLGQG